MLFWPKEYKASSIKKNMITVSKLYRKKIPIEEDLYIYWKYVNFLTRVATYSSKNKFLTRKRK